LLSAAELAIIEGRSEGRNPNVKMRVKVHNPGVDWGRTLFGLLGLLGLGAIIWLWFDFFFGHREISEKGAQADFGCRVALSVAVAFTGIYVWRSTLLWIELGDELVIRSRASERRVPWSSIREISISDSAVFSHPGATVAGLPFPGEAVMRDYVSYRIVIRLRNGRTSSVPLQPEPLERFWQVLQKTHPELIQGMRFIDCECGARIPFTERQAGTRARCGDCAREYQLPSLSELRRGQ
jgi:hypothetical protein